MKRNFVCSLSVIASIGFCSLTWMLWCCSTEPSPDQQFKQIRHGMSQEEVHSVLGKPHYKKVWSNKVEQYWIGEQVRIGVDTGNTGVVQHIWTTPIRRETSLALLTQTLFDD